MVLIVAKMPSKCFALGDKIRLKDERTRMRVTIFWNPCCKSVSNDESTLKVGIKMCAMKLICAQGKCVCNKTNS